MSPSTYYRRIATTSSANRDSTLRRIMLSPTPVLHWLDNYAKYDKTGDMHSGTDLMRSVLWTAHGVKFLSSTVDLSWVRVDNRAIPAMPPLEILFAKTEHASALDKLRTIPRLGFDLSAVVNNDVRRIPIKLPLICLNLKPLI